MSEPRRFDVCIAGGGPAGMVLGYLLARCGISTLVLESQADFDRDFRGDTLHSGVMEIFQAIGLSDEILSLPHFKIPSLSVGGVELRNGRRNPIRFSGWWAPAIDPARAI